MAWPNVGPESFRSCSTDVTLNLTLSDGRRRGGECHRLTDITKDVQPLKQLWSVFIHVFILQRGQKETS